MNKPKQTAKAAPKTEPKNIHEAILKVYQVVEYIKKDGRVKFGKTDYTYASEAAVIKAIRPAMVKMGITCYPSGLIETSREEITNEFGKTTRLTKSTYVFTFRHASSGTEIESVGVGEGIDSTDKGASKAATNAFKYALRQTFMIETGDEADRECSEEYDNAKPKTPFKSHQDRVQYVADHIALFERAPDKDSLERHYKTMSAKVYQMKHSDDTDDDEGIITLRGAYENCIATFNKPVEKAEPNFPTLDNT